MSTRTFNSRLSLSSLLIILISLLCSQTQAQSNLRLGVGMVMLDTTPSVASIKNGQSKAVSLFAEMPQSEHSGSRFLIYSKQPSDGEKYWGFESQIFWGWGLNQPGLRLYTGPAWHYEKHRFTQDTALKTLYGWGWNTGIGVQVGALQFDIAGNYRDPSDYSKIKNQTPTVWFFQALVGYRF